MAGNEWIGGYLDAILNSGQGLSDDVNSTAKKIGADKEALTTTKYFINELEWEDAQALARRHMEKQCGQRMGLDEMSHDDLSEGEKEPMVPEMATIIETPENPKCAQQDKSEVKEKKLYMVLISLHGLVRGDNMELGRDSDTRGQVKYVVELARALSLMPEVYRVDLLTRQICDPKVDWSYGEPTEMLAGGSYDEETGEEGESSGAPTFA